MTATQSTKAQSGNCGCQAGPHITCRKLQAAFVSNFDGRPTTGPCPECGELPEAHDASLSSRRFLVRLSNGGGIYSACDREGAERVSADWAGSEVTDQEPQTRTAKTSTPAIRLIPADTAEYARDYNSGWRVSQRAEDGALERADARNVSHAWYDGYEDYAIGNPKWTKRDERLAGDYEPETMSQNDATEQAPVTEVAPNVVVVRPDALPDFLAALNADAPTVAIDRARTVTHRNGITQVFRTAQRDRATGESAIGAYQRYGDSYRTYAPDGSSLGTWATETGAYTAIAGDPEPEIPAESAAVWDDGSQADYLARRYAEESAKNLAANRAAEIPAEAWPSGKTFGELTPVQRQAAMHRAAAQLQAELTANAPAISKVLDDPEA